MTVEEFQRLSLRSFKESEEYNFVNLAFGLISAASNIAHAFSNAGKHNDLSFRDKDLRIAHLEFGRPVLRNVTYNLCDVLMTTSVFASYLGFNLEDLMEFCLDTLADRQSIDDLGRKGYFL